MNDTYLRSGIFLAPFQNLEINPTLALERDMELLEHLDRLNYHEAWIGEHHSGGFEIIACPEMFIAGAAGRTRHIRLGTGVVSLPYHHPFVLADRMVQLDHMTRGRASSAPRLHAPAYGDGGCRIALARGRPGFRQIWNRDALDRRHVAAGDGAPRLQLGSLRGNRTCQRPCSRPQELAHRRHGPYRGDAREGPRERQVRTR